MDCPCPEDIKELFTTVISNGEVHYPESACKAYFEWLSAIYPKLLPGDRIEVRGSDDDSDGWYWWHYQPRIN